MTAKNPSTSGKRPRAKKLPASRRWIAGVMATSNALDLPDGIFTWSSPRRIALGLKRSAEASTRRKGTPYQSAISMLTFAINRGGRGLTAERRATLERAKDELRRLFGRAPGSSRRAA